MRFNEFKQVETKVIAESKGFFGRNAGDKFTHQDGREYAIVQVVAYPDAQTQKFETPEARDEAIKQFQEESQTATREWMSGISIDEAKQTILSEFEKHKNFYQDER